MANIRDYLSWRGDITFAERPFNDVDNLVLSALAYLDFSGIIPGEESGDGTALGEACTRLLEQARGDITPYVRSLARIDTSFVELLAASARFRDAQLQAYVDVIDEERALQFSAMQVDLPASDTYVAFRGTDNTLVGWREDFMLSFTITQAQREAASYLHRAIERAIANGRSVRTGGHSKGGMLAEYAARCLPDELCRHVLSVYSNDGPGMAPEVMPTEQRKHLGTLLRRIVPSYSVVGMLFTRTDKPRTIVASSARGIGQHDLITWKVARDRFEEVEKIQPDCLALDQAIAKWMGTLSLEERKLRTTELFDMLEASGATRLDDIASSLAHDAVRKVFRGRRG